jgi:heat shock protein HtpX
MLVIAVIIAGVIGFVAELVFRMMFHSGLRGGFRSRGGGDRKGGGGAIIAILIAVALIAVAWFLSIVIRFALSRRREFLADAGAVELTKNPDAMITALRKIENRGELEGATSAVMEMCFDNPRSGFADLFATHPSVERRVEALVQFAGGHDPGPLALPEPDEAAPEESVEGPWGDSPAQPGGPTGDKPFLPQQPPVSLGSPSSPVPPVTPGPWGPRR